MFLLVTKTTTLFYSSFQSKERELQEGLDVDKDYVPRHLIKYRDGTPIPLVKPTRKGKGGRRATKRAASDAESPPTTPAAKGKGKGKGKKSRGNPFHDPDDSPEAARAPATRKGSSTAAGGLASRLRSSGGLIPGPNVTRVSPLVRARPSRPTSPLEEGVEFLLSDDDNESLPTGSQAAGAGPTPGPSEGGDQGSSRRSSVRTSEGEGEEEEEVEGDDDDDDSSVEIIGVEDKESWTPDQIMADHQRRVKMGRRLREAGVLYNPIKTEPKTEPADKPSE